MCVRVHRIFIFVRSNCDKLHNPVIVKWRCQKPTALICCCCVIFSLSDDVMQSGELRWFVWILVNSMCITKQIAISIFGSIDLLTITIIMGTHIGNTNYADRLEIRNAKHDDWLRLKMAPGKKKFHKNQTCYMQLYTTFLWKFHLYEFCFPGPIFNRSQSNEDWKTDWSRESFKFKNFNRNELTRYHVATEMSSYLYILTELIKKFFFIHTNKEDCEFL